MNIQRKWKEHSVWQALVGLVMVAVLPLLIFGGGVAWMIVDQKKLAIADNLKSTTSALRVAVDHELLGQMKQVEILATDASLDADNLAAFIMNAKRVIATNGKWFTVSLIDPRSHAIVATTATPVAGALASVASNAVDDVFKTRKSMIVGAFTSGVVTKKPFSLLMAPVFRNDQVRFVLSVAMDPNAINSLFAEQNLPSTWTGAIIDSRLVLAGRSRDPERYVGVPATPSLAKPISASQSGLFTAINQEGNTVYTVFDRSVVTGWSMVIGIPAKEVEEPIQLVLKQLILAATALLAFALGLAWLVGLEIVRRQQAESQLNKDIEEKSAQLETIFALSPDGFVSFNASHCVNYVSPAFSRLSGFSIKSVLGLNEFDFSEKLASACIPTRRFSGIASMMTKQVEDQGRDHHFKNTIVVAAPGNKVLRIALRKGTSDSVSQILHIRNVTHETEVENLKNEFLATAAHELRTPMASILGFSEVLLNSDFDEDERHEMTSIIHRQSVLIAKIINDLLDLARIEARRGDDFILETANIHDLVTKTIKDFKVPEHRDFPIVVAASESLNINVDCGKFQQALTNIISNAYKYSPEGGNVIINFRIKTEKDRQFVGVTVIDQGIGMTAAQLERVFERFYRADTSGKIPGTGLGMNIVQEIIEIHHGRVDVHSTMGKGTTVTVWLPRAI
ncbi:MAG: ATP-binding protein [Rhodoferax sp.]|uniref:ATP-binding protein n=1 Tax=Rhodoferax sp. TaxID=50421 RepID=UPI003017C937